jgi:hypothetical protein
MTRFGIGRKLVALGVVALAAASCKSKDAASGVDAGPPAPDAAAAAQADESDDDEVRPVYPIDGLPPVPLAQRYCEATREVARKRREECCPSMRAYAPTDQCVRTLSSALRSGAVTVEESAIDACASAVARATAGCDWVTSTGTPTDSACLGILQGTLKEGATCRSNLECEEGMRCIGLGATKPGRCAAHLAARSVCNLATDSLAVFTGQDDYDRHHPECAGYCRLRQCMDATAIGARCATSAECGAKAWCVAGACKTALPSAGEACTDACANGARCAKGICQPIEPRRECPSFPGR